MITIHRQFVTTLLIYTGALVLWSFYLYFRKRDINSSFLGALAIDAVLFAVQFIFGLVLVLQVGIGSIRWVHILYGSVGLITIPALYLYTKGRTTYHEALAYGITLLFLIGVVFRAAGSARPV